MMQVVDSTLGQRLIEKLEFKSLQLTRTIFLFSRKVWEFFILQEKKEQQQLKRNEEKKKKTGRHTFVRRCYEIILSTQRSTVIFFYVKESVGCNLHICSPPFENWNSIIVFYWGYLFHKNPHCIPLDKSKYNYLLHQRRSHHFGKSH